MRTDANEIFYWSRVTGTDRSIFINNDCESSEYKWWMFYLLVTLHRWLRTWSYWQGFQVEDALETLLTTNSWGTILSFANPPAKPYTTCSLWEITPLTESSKPEFAVAITLQNLKNGLKRRYHLIITCYFLLSWECLLFVVSLEQISFILWDEGTVFAATEELCWGEPTCNPRFL